MKHGTIMGNQIMDESRRLNSDITNIEISNAVNGYVVKVYSKSKIKEQFVYTNGLEVATFILHILCLNG